MENVNPYESPDANLTAGDSETYQPKPLQMNGRIGRLRYFAYSLIMYPYMLMIGVIAAIFSGVGASMGEDLGLGLLGIAYIPLIVYGVVLGKRRCHDLNRTAWMLLLYLIPFVGAFFALYMLFASGTNGSNNYGPAATPNSSGVKTAAGVVLVLLLGLIGAAVILPAMYI
jgi:uncharacterized membrane protein YhaH (DUF805 family)